MPKPAGSNQYKKNSKAKSPSVKSDLMGSIKGLSTGAKTSMAHNPSTPVNKLLALSKDPDNVIRQEVAANPSAPHDLQAHMMGDNRWVRQGVAKNPEPIEEFLITLADDDHWTVRKEVARNAKTPSRLLAKLAKDNNDTVRYWVANNPNTEKTTLSVLAKDDVEIVKRYALEHLNR